MTEKQRRWYEDALSAYANGNGQRWNGNLTGKLTTAAIACGLSAETVISDAAARMPHFTREHAAKIRTDMETAARRQGARFIPGKRSDYRKTPEQDGFPNYVRELIAAGGGTATSGDLFELSPIDVRPYAKDGRTATALFLRTLWKSQDLLHVFAKDRPIVGRIGCDLRTRDEWLDILSSAPLPGDCIKKNPFTGKVGVTRDAKQSFIADDCIAEYKFALVEFDDLPLRAQLAFWRGYLTKPNLAPNLASLTYSGGKSLHGLIRTNATVLTAPTIQANFLKLFHADPTSRSEADAAGIVTIHYPYRADKSGLGKSQGTRIAGAHRIDNDPKRHGRLQTLIYLSDGSRTPTPKRMEIPPPRQEIDRPIIITSPPQTADEQPANDTPEANADHADDATFAAKCCECPTAEDCKHAFGKFWNDRSHGGIGCNHPFMGWGKASNNPHKILY